MTIDVVRKSVYVADFETTTDENDCRVWGFGIGSLFAETADAVVIGTDIQHFMSIVSKMNAIIYFHNLSFDGSFIFDWLLNNGYKHTMDRPRRGEFTTLIDGMGKHYTITVAFMSGRTVEFRDSLKKFPNMSVERIATSFKLEITKGEIDYHKQRPIGWEITDEEADYIRRDVFIIIQALRIQYSEGMTKLTVGSDSMAEYRRLVGGKSFKTLFPILDLAMDSEIRKAYRGGFTYADNRRKGKVVGAGKVYDVNSLYPYVMKTRCLPFGSPVFTEGSPQITEERPLFITSVTLTAKLKPGHIPCIQTKNNMLFSPTEYITDIPEPTTLYCTNVDLELWKDHYDMEIQMFNGSWMFHGVPGMFDDYINKWSEIKAKSDGGIREIAKLHLNSLYGKFASNPIATRKIPVLDGNIVKLKRVDDDTKQPVYTAMGVFVTSYAREITIRSAQKHYDRFLYADTDSLHLLGLDEPSLNIHPTELGAWKHEYDFEKAIFARAKAYTELTESGYETHIAGLPAKIAKKVTFDDYLNGRTFPGKLMPKRVPGGIVLSEIEFTLKKVI